MAGSGYRPRPLVWTRLTDDEVRARARGFHDAMSTRRSVRQFAPDPIPLDAVELAIATAATAPSGAHQQPWTFVLVTDADLKQRIRAAAEAEERASYDHRMSAEWLAALGPLGTGWQKPHLTDAPCLIAVFEQAYGLARDDAGAERRIKHYYAQESVGIAVGFLLAALHQAGLAALTHTPSPMRFLAALLGRPANERAFVLIPVGWPAAGAEVPSLERKPLAEVLVKR